MLSQDEITRLRKLAHDLNNALAPIVMAGELLRPSVTDPRSARLLETLCSSAQHGTDLVQQIQLLVQPAHSPVTPPAPPPHLTPAGVAADAGPAASGGNAAAALSEHGAAGGGPGSPR